MDSIGMIIKATKVCSKCKEVKDTSEFYKQKFTKDGLRSTCKACDRRAFLKTHPPKPKEILPEGKKRCSKCKEVIDKAEFTKAKSAKDGLHSWCRACARKIYLIKHPPKEVEILPEGKKRCSQCKEVKDKSEFNTNTQNKTDGLRPECRDCSFQNAIGSVKNRRAELIRAGYQFPERKVCITCGVEKNINQLKIRGQSLNSE